MQERCEWVIAGTNLKKIDDAVYEKNDYVEKVFF